MKQSDKAVPVQAVLSIASFILLCTSSLTAWTTLEKEPFLNLAAMMKCSYDCEVVYRRAGRGSRYESFRKQSDKL